MIQLNFEYKGPPVFGRTFVFYFRYTLSFVWPVIVERARDARNRPIMLVFEYGRLVVNSPNANYSYGNLQKAFARAFCELGIPRPNMSRILIAGFGAGSVAQTLRRELQWNGVITGIESDAQLLQWYNRYFPDTGTTTQLLDAYSFLGQCQETFDLLIIDLFDDLHVPAKFQEQTFIDLCKSTLSDQGMLLFNFVVDQPEHEAQYAALLEKISKRFRNIQVSKQMDVNRLILAF